MSPSALSLTLFIPFFAAAFIMWSMSSCLERHFFIVLLKKGKRGQNKKGKIKNGCELTSDDLLSSLVVRSQQ